MDHLLAAGVDRFIVNTHHLPESFQQVFSSGEWRGRPVILRHEPVLLDTAGGLKNIEDLLEEDDAIFCYNGDILTDLPLRELVEFHEKNRPEATLVLRSAGHLVNVNVDSAGNVVDIRATLHNPGIRSCQFACIYAAEKSLLGYIIAGKIESIADVFIERIRTDPGSIKGVVIDAGFWHDIGSIEVYQHLTSRKEELEGS